jgi:hypothetical protein
MFGKTFYAFPEKSSFWAKRIKKLSQSGKRLFLAEFKDESIGIKFQSSSFITKDHGIK